MNKMQFQYFNFKKIALGSVIAFIFGILFGFVIFPKLLKIILSMQVRLKPGNEVREMYNEMPFPLDFLIYVFNITNPDSYINGEKIILKEIGPYYFEEWKEKYERVDDAEEDTISFNMRNTFIFRADKSNGLTGEEIITVPHILFQSIGLVVKRDRPGMLNLVMDGISDLFPNGSAIWKGSFMDLFFRGYAVDCSSDRFAAKAICSAFYTGEVKTTEPLNSTHYLFSLMRSINHTNVGRFKVCRGMKNIHKLGKIIGINDEPELDVWSGEECNKFQGTDSTIFPPFLKPEDGVWAYTPDICRSMGAVYRRKSKYAGMPASRYHLDLGDIKADESLHCFCNDPPDDCPLKGTMDLFPCTSAPLIASMPHFFAGDPSLFENIEGLRPTEEEHAVFIDFEPMSGTPFRAAKRLQFNLDQEPQHHLDALSKLKKMVVPIFWVEEGVALNKTYTNMVKPLFIGLIFNQIVRWTCIIVGGLGFVAALFLHMFSSKIANNSTEAINVKPETDSSQQKIPNFQNAGQNNKHRF